MEPDFTTAVVIIATVLFFGLAGYGQEPSQRAKKQRTAETMEYRECSGSAKACKPEIKFIGQRKGCACYACEYGAKTEHLVCTRDKGEKQALAHAIKLQENLHEEDQATAHKNRKAPKEPREPQ